MGIFAFVTLVLVAGAAVAQDLHAAAATLSGCLLAGTALFFVRRSRSSGR